MKKSIVALLGMVAVGLSACGSSDPLGTESKEAKGNSTIVVGSQDYYSNEIIAEVYAQVLEKHGFDVERDLRIGQREVYMPDIKSGRITVFPEYTGNFLQYLDPQSKTTMAADVVKELKRKLPKGLYALDPAPATDQDSYVVTRELAEKYGLETIGDLAKVKGLVLGGNAELETRPYGPRGLKDIYGVDVKFTPVEDSGGSLTLKALQDGQIQVANIYSSDPVLANPDLVVLKDPQAMFLSSQVIPVVAGSLTVEAAEVLNSVSQKLAPQDLVAMNIASTKNQKSAKLIAKEWIESKKL
ncbi:ABC transporter substrate-binding protein [Arcanobacterium ihumii]|uniref:ABC transporter substrate-binding protein n=1 Tax=Arcanobacterium ihumii TaxID=2138162 RepID=UPI000F53167B|nr:ABC transporter substrate-binding protein [Arcanobacterium ihumii]